MKYFDVKREELRGSLMSGLVYSDGEYVEEADEVEIRTLTTGFNVYEYDEQGLTQNVEFYPVETNMETWEDNANDVLNYIIEDHPAGEWQNNNW